MGVPKFYRWLSERFPQINTVISDSTLVPEFDNMYLDMNGIIHACSHPNDADLSKTISLKDMMLGIFRYIDRMVSEIAKPKKILFMAIDGCAPRAKMNQQRARRFRSAQEQVANITKARDNGEDIDLENLFDSNCITPGTEFMDTVGEHIKWYIRKKIKEDPIWQQLEVVFSGHDVPGEGEHKIMQFIRELKSRPNYKPNQRHCMYGADADLIMLGLATHEPHFTLLREVVEFNFRGPNANKTVMRQTKDVKFQLLHISVLREYIELDMSLGCARSVDKERLIDDFIFLTFLVGNDFLPHLPTLDIGEHAFDVIFTAYKQLLRESDGYLVTDGELQDLPRLEALFQKIGKQEHDILANREVLNNKNKSRSRLSKEQKQSEAIDKAAKDAAYDEALAEALSLGLAIGDADKLLYTEVKSDFIHEEETEEEDGNVLEEKEGAPPLTSAKDYRGRYYFDKFKIIPSTANVESQEFLHTLCTHYFEGLTWCLAYYIKGCISWTWYYPYNYGPMLIDMKNLNAIKENMNFTLGRPFFPFQQLLGCLPPASARLLPKPYQFLMTNEVSPLLKYYPLDFAVDQDGKKNPWEAVVILPFIDETDLLTAEAQWCNESTLTPAEKKRNTFGSILLYRYDPLVTSTYTAVTTASGIYDITQCSSTCIEIAPQFDPRCSFAPSLVPGTTLPISGFPSLGVLRISKVETKELKLNCFGSDSKYKTVKLQLSNTPYDPETMDLRTIVGRTVYVNYPCMHEAFVIGVSTYDQKFELAASDRDPNIIRRAEPEVVVKRHNGIDMEKFKTMAKREESRYLKGCGIPGLGGVDIGTVDILLHVVVLQGMKVDPVSGAKRKFYGTQEAIMPYQTTLSVLPMVDNRFIESSSTPVSEMFPYACKVVGVAGQFTGVDGIVVGPHNSENITPKGINEGNTNRYIDVEMNLRPPEPNFSSIIANSMNEKYYPSREICKSVGITPGVLGRILGALYVGNDRINVGLDMRKNGEYYLPGYTRVIDSGDGNSPNKGSKKSGKVDSVWSRNDSVTVVGSNVTDDVEKEAAAGNSAERTNWEYSAKVVHVLLEYKTHFPEVMKAMMDNPEEKKFSTKAIFGGDNHEEKFMQLLFWLKKHPICRIPRAPLNTQTLPVEIVGVIENTTLQMTNFIKQRGLDKARVTKMPLNAVIKETVGNSGEVTTTFNKNLVPVLGDRVVSINALGVPFGQRGTVTAIHSSTGYVEVLFDEEFVGGRPIQGCVSLFKGRLCPWRHLLCLRNVGAPQAKAAGKVGSAGGVQIKKKEAVQTKEKEEANTKVAPPPAPETAKVKKPESKGRAALLEAAKGDDGSTDLAKSAEVSAELLDYQYVPKPSANKPHMPNKAKKSGTAKGPVSKEEAVDMLKKTIQTKRIVPSLLVKKKADSK